MKLHKLHFAFACLVCFCRAAAMEEREILQAAGNGKTKQVSKLLTKDPNLVNVQDDDERTPLHLASAEGHTETAEHLLRHKADVNAKDDDKLTPLHEASWRGHTETAKLLLQHKAVVNAQDFDEWTPLHLASAEGHTDTAKLLLQHKAVVNAQDFDERTPLHLASAEGHTDTAKLLLSYGAIPYFPINLFERFSSFSKLYAQGHQAFINKVKKEREKVFWILYSIEYKKGGERIMLPAELCDKIVELAFSGIQEWHQFKKAHPEIAELADAQEGKLP